MRGRESQLRQVGMVYVLKSVYGLFLKNIKCRVVCIKTEVGMSV